MGEPNCSLHGHTRSMSSLASTIVPLYFESPEIPAVIPPETLCFGRVPDFPDGNDAMDIPDELRIPLPPSSACSEYGENEDAREPSERPPSSAEDKPKDGSPVYAPVSIQDVSRDEDGSQRSLSVGDQPITAGNIPPTGNEAIEPVTFRELVRTLRKEKFELERFHALEGRVHSLLGQCGIHQRLLPVHSHLYRLMVDRLMTDNTPAFVSLYSQIIELQQISNDTMHFRSNQGTPNWSHLFGSTQERALSWIQNMPAQLVTGITRLICKIRTDPGFLADRIIKLSSSQLYDLTRPHKVSITTESTTQTPTGFARFDLRNHRKPHANPKDSRELLSAMQHDPLVLLIHGIFDVSSISGCKESYQQLDVWSSVCAQTIADGKPGSDDFCITVLNSIAASEPWRLEPQLEVLLLDLLRSGAFLFDRSRPRSVDFTQPTELHDARLAIATSEFYAKSLDRILSLITQGPPEVAVPRRTSSLIQAILDKIADPGKKTKAKNFFVTRWYIGTFISDAVVFPESHGIMMHCYISSTARKIIFQEIANRLQKHFYDTLSTWKQAVPTAPQLEATTRKLLDMFDPPESQNSQTNSSSMSLGQEFLVLSPQDVLAIVRTLYPNDRADDIVLGLPESSIPSAPSSVAGSSTLTSGTDEGRTNTSSSVAVSVSGTSMTSDTLSCDLMTGALATFSGTQTDTGVDHVEPPQVAEGVRGETFSASPKLLVHELTKVVNDQAPAPGLALETADYAFFYIDQNGSTLSLSPLPIEDDKPIPDEASPRDSGSNHKSPIHGNDRFALMACLTRIAQGHNSDIDVDTLSRVNTLEHCLQTRTSESEARYDFQSAHFWWKGLGVVRRTPEEDLNKIAMELEVSSEDKASTAIRLSKLYESWLYTLANRQSIHDQDMEQRMNRSKALRDKMWFAADVRHSSTYEDALNVTRALKTMSKSAQAKPTGLTAWARQRLRSSLGSDRAQAQALEVLAAPKDHGGPAKLSDKQVELTSRWLTRQSIENFCTGEERIHRFALEIQKCTNRLVGETLLDSPVLWSSKLYQHEKQGIGRESSSLGLNETDSTRREIHKFHQPYDQGASHFVNPTSPRKAGVSSPPPNTFKESPFPPWNGTSLHIDSPRDSLVASWTSHDTDLSASLHRSWKAPPSPISPISPMSYQQNTDSSSSPKSRFVERLKRTVRSLLLSDLGYALWNDGSETDRWMSDRLLYDQPDSTQECIPKSVAPQDDIRIPGNNDTQNTSGTVSALRSHPDSLSEAGRASLDEVHGAGEASHDASHSQSTFIFPFTEAYKKLLDKFSLSCDPHIKLQALYDLVRLASISQMSKLEPKNRTASSSLDSGGSTSTNTATTGIRGVGVPRTRLTRLEEVMANCEERRLISVKSHGLTDTRYATERFSIDSASGIKTHSDVSSIIHRILRDPSLYPRTLFRDLQYIATFVPSSMLDHTPQGTAFWTVAIAAVSLKSDICKSMTQRANQIVAYHYEKPSAKAQAEIPSTSSTLRSPTSLTSPDPHHRPDLATTPLSTAAHLYTLSALEGDPTAARELGLFYLMHPEGLPRVTLPLSRAGEVFGPQMVGRGGVAEAQQGNGLDPYSFALAFHWMEFAANAGDEDARAFLRGNGDWGRGR